MCDRISELKQQLAATKAELDRYKKMAGLTGLQSWCGMYLKACLKVNKMPHAHALSGASACQTSSLNMAFGMRTPLMVQPLLMSWLATITKGSLGPLAQCWTRTARRPWPGGRIAAGANLLGEMYADDLLEGEMDKRLGNLWWPLKTASKFFAEDARS